MYNEERKMQFLTTRNRETAAKYQALFNSIASKEELAHKDLADFSADDLVQYLGGRSAAVSSLKNIVSMVSQYQKWCVIHGLALTVSAKQIVPEDLCNTAQAMVASPQDLHARFDQMFCPETESTMDCLLRLYGWCAFAGIPLNFVVKLQNEDIQLDACIIRADGVSYQMPPQARISMRQCVENTMFKIALSNGKFECRKRRNNHNVFRAIKTECFAAENLGDQFRKRSRSALSYTRIQTSGMFYRAYLEAPAHNKSEADFHDIAIRDVETCYQNSKIPRKQLVEKVARKYQRDYLQWYRTFYG